MNIMVDPTDPMGMIDPVNTISPGFNPNVFNLFYEKQDIEKLNKKKQRLIELNKLAEDPEPIPVYDLSIYQIIINTKDAWFDILDDLLAKEYHINVLIRNNRLFYIGITFIFFALFIYLYNILVSPSEPIIYIYPMRRMDDLNHIVNADNKTKLN